MLKQLRDPERKKVSQDERRRRVDIPEFRWSDIRLLPNILTLSRVVLIIPAVIIIAKSHGGYMDEYAAILLALGFFTDVLDGNIARLTNTISALGKILDPIVDKFVVMATAAALAFSDRDPGFPVWLLVAIMCRDGVILAAALRALQEDHYLFVSAWTGKVTTLATAITLMIFLLDQYVPDNIVAVAPWIVLGLLILSSVDYLERYWSVRHKRFISREEQKKQL